MQNMSHSLNIYCTSYLPSLLVHLCCLWFCSVITLLNNPDVIGKWQTFNSQTFIIVVIFVDVQTRQPHKHASDSYLKISWSFMMFQCMRFTLVLTSDSMALRCGSFFMIAPSPARLFSFIHCIYWSHPFYIDTKNHGSVCRFFICYAKISSFSMGKENCTHFMIFGNIDIYLVRSDRTSLFETFHFQQSPFSWIF